MVFLYCEYKTTSWFILHARIRSLHWGVASLLPEVYVNILGIRYGVNGLHNLARPLIIVFSLLGRRNTVVIRLIPALV